MNTESLFSGASQALWRKLLHCCINASFCHYENLRKDFTNPHDIHVWLDKYENRGCSLYVHDRGVWRWLSQIRISTCAIHQLCNLGQFLDISEFQLPYG